MRFSKIHGSSILALATCLAVALPTAAYAQQAAGAALTPAQSQTKGEEADAISREIIVTGSRVVANGNNSPTPVTVLSVEAMAEVHPATVAEQLNDLPQFSNSQTQNNGQGAGSANTGNPNPTGNVLNLRNFGQTRNLVLFDGHRVAPNSANGTVDIDMIPQLLLKRVDVVTGGASAVYGADAVTGVINFITDTGFKGFKANAQAGISSRGDGGQQAIGVAWGGGFLENRAHLLLSYEYRKDEGIDHRSARPWGAERDHLGQIGGTVTVAGVPTATYGWITKAARAQNSFGGTITSAANGPANPYNNYYFISPGMLTPMTGGTVLNANSVENGSGGYFDPSLRAALQMHQAFGRLDVDVTDHVHFYARGAFTDTKNEGYGIPNPTYIPNSGNFAPVFVTNPYLVQQAPQVAQAMANAGVTRFLIGKLYGGPAMDQYRQFTQTFGRNWSADIGLNGDVGGFKWEVAYIHSDNHQRTVGNNAVNGRKVAASLDAVNDGGTIKCWVNTAAGQAALAASPNAAALQNFYQGCVPQSTVFGPTITAAEADYLFDPLQVITNIKMDDVEAFVSGSPFSTWAGAVTVALSGQARKQSYEVISGSSPASLANPLDCTGLRLLTAPYNCTATSLEYFQAESYSRPKTSVSVKELAFEANVPLLRDTPFFRSLSVSGAARYTDYSTSGGIWSWKGGVDWSVTDDLTFRGTRSRDIRAPTLHELFQPTVVGSFNATDVLLGKTLQTAPLQPAGEIASGNPDLKPERADTLTAGLVYRPSWLSGFSVAIDYFDIRVADAIVTLQGSASSTQNDCIASGGASPSCALIVRPIDCCTTKTDANAATRFFTRPINIARQYTRGVDMELNYTTRIATRPFNLRLLATYQPKNVYVDGITGVQTNNAGSGLAFGTNGNIGAGAKWRGTLIASMDVVDGVRFSIQERYRGKMNFVPEITGTAAAPATQYILQNAPAGVPARVYTNVNVSFKTGPGEFYINVQNLFDTQPAPWASVNSGLPGNNNVAPGDDPVGRFFTAGVRLRF